MEAVRRARRPRAAAKAPSALTAALRLVCACSYPMHVVLWRFVGDMTLILTFLPSMLLRTDMVHRQTCPPQWTSRRCDDFVDDFYVEAVAGCVALALLLAIAYAALRERITARLDEGGALAMQRAHAYVIVFFGLHLFLTCAACVYVHSVQILYMFPLLLCGAAADLALISKASAALRADAVDDDEPPLPLAPSHSARRSKAHHQL